MNTFGYASELALENYKDLIKIIEWNSKNKVDIELNNTALIIGEIDYIEIDENIINDHGILHLENSNAIGFGGLTTYYYLNKLIEINNKYNEI